MKPSQTFVESLGMNSHDVPLVLALSWVTPKLLDDAANAAERLRGSYRGFNVGNASLAVDALGWYFSVIGANYKADGRRKVCAEQLTLARAVANKLQILSFHVDAPVQPDTHSGLLAPTLHPCGDCRGTALTHGNVNPEAPVITRARGTHLHQVMAPYEVQAAHASRIPVLLPAQETIEDDDYRGLRVASQMYDVMLSEANGASPAPPAWDLRGAWIAGLQNSVVALH
jgi:cytidine deaminase